MKIEFCGNTLAVAALIQPLKSKVDLQKPLDARLTVNRHVEHICRCSYLAPVPDAQIVKLEASFAFLFLSEGEDKVLHSSVL